MFRCNAGWRVRSVTQEVGAVSIVPERRVRTSGKESGLPRNSHAIPAHGHHGATLKLGGVAGDEVCHDDDAFTRRDVRETDDPFMACTVAEDQLSEVSVDRYKDARFRRCPIQYAPVARIGAPVSGVDDV